MRVSSKTFTAKEVVNAVEAFDKGSREKKDKFLLDVGAFEKTGGKVILTIEATYDGWGGLDTKEPIRKTRDFVKEGIRREKLSRGSWDSVEFNITDARFQKDQT